MPVDPHPLFANQPENAHSLMLFWFWNDTLEPEEILRQIADFQSHGVDGFVLHPRIGLPHHQGWMSTGLIDMMRVALEEACEQASIVSVWKHILRNLSACGKIVFKGAMAIGDGT